MPLQDAGGNVLADRGGVVSGAISATIGTVSDQNPDTITSTSPTLIPGCAIAFTLARAQRVFFSVTMSGRQTTASTTADGFIFIDALQIAFIGRWDSGNGGVTNASIAFFSETLSAGNHVISLLLQVSGGTWTNNASGFTVYSVAN